MPSGRSEPRLRPSDRLEAASRPAPRATSSSPRPPAAKVARGILALILTGLAVEIALTPIALYHFHKSGLYGALANIVAIPLTTFVIMPLEALALL